MNLPQLQPDKANHFIYGALASVAGVAMAAAFGVPITPAALLYAAAVGVGKEVWDRASGQGMPDRWDAVATAAGGLPAALAAWVAS